MLIAPPKKPLARRQKIAIGVLAVYVGSFLVFGMFYRPPPSLPPTQEQLKLEKQLADERKDRDRDNVYWCSLAVVCSKYAEVRDQCAVAGDFTNCLRVKLKDDWNRIDQCADGGKLIDPPANMPDTFQCIGSELRNWTSK
jgi:hypothetical protein